MTREAHVAASLGRFCLDCAYDVHASEKDECPECGRAFDPANPATYAQFSVDECRKALARVVVIAAWVLLPLTLSSFACSLLGWHGLFTHVNELVVILVCLASFVGVVFLTTPMMPIARRSRSRVEIPLIVFGGLLLPIFGCASPVFLIGLPVLAALQLLVTTFWPAVPVRQRVRLAVACSIALIASILVLDWPFRVSFRLHQSAFENAVASMADLPLKPIGDGSPVPLGGPMRIGIYKIHGVTQEASGIVGFRVGGGLMIIRSVDSRVYGWPGQNWTRPLGNGWSVSMPD